jgi:hypothetical protein
MIDPTKQTSRTGDQTSDRATRLGAGMARALSSMHSRADKSRAFEWLRALATAEGAPTEAGVALDSWADLAFSALAHRDGAAVQTEAIREALSVCRSVCTGSDRRIVHGGCVMYMQTADWCVWLEAEVAPKLEAALGGSPASGSGVTRSPEQDEGSDVLAARHQVPWLLNGEVAMRIANEHRVRTCIVQDVAKAVHAALAPAAIAQERTATTATACQPGNAAPGGGTLLTVQTRHPTDYVLMNEADGTRWRAQQDGSWKAEPAASETSVQMRS